MQSGYLYAERIIIQRIIVQGADERREDSPTGAAAPPRAQDQEDQSEKPDKKRDKKAKRKKGRGDIPAGHRPPPGECRDWNPNLPPGQQPPPRKC